MIFIISSIISFAACKTATPVFNNIDSFSKINRENVDLSSRGIVKRDIKAFLKMNPIPELLTFDISVHWDGGIIEATLDLENSSNLSSKNAKIALEAIKKYMYEPISGDQSIQCGQITLEFN